MPGTLGTYWAYYKIKLSVDRTYRDDSKKLRSSLAIPEMLACCAAAFGASAVLEQQASVLVVVGAADEADEADEDGVQPH